MLLEISTRIRSYSMGHDYGVPIRFLSVTPTRDNEAAPGNRLADKHSRLFNGKTLDEWLMLQLWSSKYLGKAVFVCETEEHVRKLSPLAQKYDIRLLVRPRDMLHPANDSGSLPISWAVEQIFKEEWFSLITTPFVVSPCRPPGFFDMMVEVYLAWISNPDFQMKAPMIIGGYETDISLWQISKTQQRGKQLGLSYLNRNPEIMGSITNHWIAASWWYRAKVILDYSRHDLSFEPIFFKIEPWMDTHIDTEDHWEEAEYWFGKKILNQGSDCYEQYREKWAHDSRR